MRARAPCSVSRIPCTHFKPPLHHPSNPFPQLQPVLRRLNIKFDSVFANEIMTEHPGAAARLLQQLKVKLDMGIGKQHLSTTAGVHRHASAVTLQTDRSRSRPAHAYMEETLFERTLRQKVQPSPLPPYVCLTHLPPNFSRL